METITSKSNSKILFATKLKQKKYRDETGLVLLEGERIINEAKNCNLVLEQVFVSKDNLNKAKNYNCKEIYVCQDNICKQLSSTISSQNIFAIARVNQNRNQTLSSKVLVLDNLQNPDNLGAIIRTAVATNFTDFLLINCVDYYNEKVIRSSMGNVFKCNFVKTDYYSIKKQLDDYQILVADKSGEDIFKIEKFPKKVALVIGNEGNGVSDELISLSNRKISIPMQNNVESLNASVSAGIIMYQIKLKGE